MLCMTRRKLRGGIPPPPKKKTRKGLVCSFSCVPKSKGSWIVNNM